MATQAVAAGRGEGVDGLQALTHFALTASGADLMVAFEADASGLATPLSSAPAAVVDAFELRASRLFDIDWSDGVPRETKEVRLPSAVLHSLGRPAKQILFIPTPVEHAPRSGLILLWGANSPRQCECPFRNGVQSGIPILSETFGQMLTSRRNSLHKQEIQDRFADLFESVPTAIVVLEGDGKTGSINERAGAILGMASGRHDISALSMAMRTIRESCVNRQDLEDAFRSQIGDVDYALTTTWDFGERQFEVDTHPVRGDGRKGRIWLFHDVTAERQVQAELRSLALSDALTGIANRRHFEDRARVIIQSVRAEDGPASLVMIDIDHFKSVNDTYGHPVGDEVLKAVAGRCRDALRGKDIIARLGGEEFAVLLPATDRGEAIDVAERLRSAIANAPVMTAAGPIDVRASLGGAVAAGSDETLEALLGRADASLYGAKRGGRNRVVFDK